MSKKTLWDQYKELLDPYDGYKEEVSLTCLFNFFDSNVLEEFLEFLKSEYDE